MLPASMRMFLVDLVRRLPMGVAIVSCGQAKSERDDNEDDDAFLLPSKDQSLPERFQP